VTGIRCWLPGGLFDGAGARQRAAKLTELNGRVERRLSEQATSAIPTLTTVLLSQVLRRIGSVTVGDPGQTAVALARSLLVADRHYLLLKLREATVGDRIQITIACPQPTCQAKIDIDFSTSEIPVKEGDPTGPLYSMLLSPLAAQGSGLADGESENECAIRFRLPTGADQEILAPIVAVDEARAATMLLQRCIQRIGTRTGPPTNADIAQLAPLAQSEIELAMEAAAPQVALTMEGACPECGQAFALPFDLAGYFLQELRRGADLLYREVHYLAYHYHWSERAILAMPKAKRRKYIEVLADEIERINDAIR